MAQLTEEQKSVLLLAGEVNRDLATSTVNKQKINPHQLMRDLGVQTNRPVMPTNPTSRFPGMIEEPRNTYSGSEIIGTAPMELDLIPVPDDIKKYADAYINETSDQPIPTTDPERQIITEPAPVPDPIQSPANSVPHQILNTLLRIEALLANGITKNKSKTRKPKNKTKKSPAKGSINDRAGNTSWPASGINKA